MTSRSAAPRTSAATRAPASSRPSAPTCRASRSATTSSTRSSPPAASAPSAPTATRTCATTAPPSWAGSCSTAPRASTPAGQDASVMAGLGTFSEHCVVHEWSAVKVLPDLPLDKVVLLGCGATTGWGSAVYAADVRPGDNVAVVGVGGLGSAAVQGARLAGAERIFAIDPVEFKRETGPEVRRHPHGQHRRGGLRADPAGDLGPHVQQGHPHQGRGPGRRDGRGHGHHLQAGQGRRHQHPPVGRGRTSRSR